MDDPYGVLGLSPGASRSEIERARRRLARRLHPDVGGDVGEMQRVNRAAERALALLSAAGSPADGRGEPAAAPEPASSRDPRRTGRAEHDVASFVIDALPVVAYEWLLVVVSGLGQLSLDDPPYLLEVLIDDPACWCRLDLVPDAGASTVSLTVAAAIAVDGTVRDAPSLDSMRDLFVRELNHLEFESG